ncbi:predicted protein [Arabidopsis lyrata subsp. lyrata]|uniref:Predicted protein n=1 Tax=Arabidopsis lyrata subsp. lyrata TaxID=81972 RepID=D7MKE7_ARALL|nr:predicted protein [Arabidopsis lyrata subsp. lyrata]
MADRDEATKRAQEKAFECILSLEEDFAKARILLTALFSSFSFGFWSEIIAIRSERDKLAMGAYFATEKLEGVMKESECKREEMNGVLARNIESSQLIIDNQRKLSENSESLPAAEEISRKLSMEATLDTVQSTKEVCEEARAAKRRKQEEHIKQLEREGLKLKRIARRKEECAEYYFGPQSNFEQCCNALKAVSVEEKSPRLLSLSFPWSTFLRLPFFWCCFCEALDMDSGGIALFEIMRWSANLFLAVEEIEKLRGEVECSKSHMLQLESALNMAESTWGSLNGERTSTSASILTEDEIKSLQFQGFDDIKLLMSRWISKNPPPANILGICNPIYLPPPQSGYNLFRPYSYSSPQQDAIQLNSGSKSVAELAPLFLFLLQNQGRLKRIRTVNLVNLPAGFAYYANILVAKALTVSPDISLVGNMHLRRRKTLKQKLEKCEVEIEKTRKTDELNLDTFQHFHKLAKIHEKYQEAVDALRHEQLGRKEAEMILQRVVSIRIYYY